MPAYDEIEALLAARTTMRGNLAQRAENAALVALADFARDSDAWYDHAAITEMTRQVVAYVEAAQAQAAQLTDAFLLEVASRLRPGRPFDTGGLVDPSALRRGVTHEGVYGRLADQFRYQASQGLAESAILPQITERASVMVSTDLQLALRDQSARWMSANDIEAWRRVVRPELAKGGTCGLCMVASDRTYYRGDLLPIHDRCGCDCLPVIGDDDPGRALNDDDLNAIYDAAGTTDGRALKAVRVKVVEHGELGPVLSDVGHRARGPREVAAATTR